MAWDRGNWLTRWVYDTIDKRAIIGGEDEHHKDLWFKMPEGHWDKSIQGYYNDIEHPNIEPGIHVRDTFLTEEEKAEVIAAVRRQLIQEGRIDPLREKRSDQNVVWNDTDLGGNEYDLDQDTEYTNSSAMPCPQCGDTAGEGKNGRFDCPGCGYWYNFSWNPQDDHLEPIGSKVALDIRENWKLIKFVSLPDRLLIGENTYHIYLLRAEYNDDMFPSDTIAIGSGIMYDDEIAQVQFDYGDEQGKLHAIRQIAEWADKNDYYLAPNLAL